MNRKALCLLLTVLTMLLTGCERRPLYDNFGGNVYLDIVIDTETTRSREPVGMNVNVYTPATDALYYNALTGPTGGYITLNPDTYHFMAYNYDTEYTLVRYDRSYHNAEAYTNEAPGNVRRNFAVLMRALAVGRGEESRAYANDPLINQPDHLYVGSLDNVKVPVAVKENEVLHVVIKASSVAEVYELHIGKVFGMQYIKEVEAFVTGQASAKSLRDGKLTNGPATLHVPIKSASAGWLYTDFNTFGKYPGGDNKVYVVLRVEARDSQVYTWEWDVTDQVDSGSHLIIVETEIYIPVTDDSGGFAPDVDQWGDVVHNIPV